MIEMLETLNSVVGHGTAIPTYSNAKQERQHDYLSHSSYYT